LTSDGSPADDGRTRSQEVSVLDRRAFSTVLLAITTALSLAAASRAQAVNGAYADLLPSSLFLCLDRPDTCDYDTDASDGSLAAALAMDDGPRHWEGAASAELATGLFRSIATSTVAGPGGTYEAPNQVATELTAHDTITLSGPIETSPLVAVILRASVGLEVQQGNSRLDVYLDADGCEAHYIDIGGPPPEFTQNPPCVEGSPLWQRSTEFQLDGTAIEMRLTREIAPGNPFDVGVSIRAQAAAGGVPDVAFAFANPARLWIEVPEGYSFTSASGDFLTNAHDPADTLTEAALALLALARRRRPR
jgi:hypothetical protein